MNKIYEIGSASFNCASCKNNNSPVGLRGEISSLNAKFYHLNFKFDKFLAKREDDREFFKQSLVDAVANAKDEIASFGKGLKDDVSD